MDRKFDYLKAATAGELERILQDNDHNYVQDDEERPASWIHASWDCEVCEAEGEVARRRDFEEAKLPGNCSVVGSPSKGVIIHSISARDLQVGYQARYLARPGVSDYPTEYAEVVSVDQGEEAVTVEWRRTNSVDVPFTAVYLPSERLTVTHYL